MKITYIMETLSIKGGLERIMTEKMNCLSAIYGYDVSLILVYDYQKPQCYDLDERVKVTELGIRKKKSLWAKFCTYFQIRHRLNSAVKALNPDIISCSSLLGVIIFSTMRFKARTIYESHGPRHKMILKWLLPLLERNVDTVVTLTEGDKNEYRIARRVEVIGNFTSLNMSGVPLKPSKSALAVGRLSAEKGFDFLIDTWAEVMKKHPDWTLDIYGEGKEKANLSLKINQKKLQNSVRLHDSIENLEKIYVHHAFVIIPSQFEGFSMVTLEAMQCGIPVVAADVPYGLREMIRNGENGLLAKRTVQDMSNAINVMIESPSLRVKYNRQTKKDVAKYNKEAIMEQWHRLFQS